MRNNTYGTKRRVDDMVWVVERCETVLNHDYGVWGGTWSKFSNFDT